MKRQSNIELVRIVSMLMIVFHHVIVHGVDSCYLSYSTKLLDSFCIYGVNLFVIISGYFKIKTTVKRFTHFYLKCVLYGGAFYLLHLLIDGVSLGYSLIYNTVLCISNAPGWWFVQVYFFLFLIAPILNKAFENMNLSELVCACGLLMLISVYFGWFWLNPVNRDGYNLVHFIWMYNIGFIICRVQTDLVKIKYIKQKLIIGYFLCSLCIFFSAVVIELYQFNISAFSYNNPFVAFGSVCLFVYFTFVNIQSNIINGIAKTTFGIYLIHENTYLSQHLYAWMFDNVVYQWQIIAVGIAIFAICGMLDYIVLRLTNPLYKRIDVLLVRYGY